MDSRGQSVSRSPSPPNTVVDLSGNPKPPRPNNGWTKEQEELMAGWADIAASYRWMHDKGEKKMALSNMWITVPVIILSTLTGSANFMLQSIVGGNEEAQKYAQIGIGSVSIFTGILTTLGNFFRYAQTSESNRVASIAWGKFQRQVAVELALHPKERIDSMDFLKICRSDLDRLIEQSPPIPDDIIAEFEKEFENITDFKRPDIAHGVDHTKVFNSKDDRLKQVAVDAAIFMKQKRKVWHEAMMPDVDKRLEKAVSDLSGSVLQAMQDRVMALEDIVQQQQEARKATSHPMSFSRNTLVERGRSLVKGVTTRVVSVAAPAAPAASLSQPNKSSNDELVSALSSKVGVAFNPLKESGVGQTTSDIVININAPDENEEKK